jgi:hypothetical protein
MRTLALVIVSLVVAAPALAHGGGEPLVFVPLDHVVQGERFPVVGAALDPRSTVTLRLGDTKLGTAKTDAEGHFKALVRAPSDFPNGYVELRAVAEDGEAVTTFVRVGADQVATPAPPAAREDGGGFPVLAAVLITAAVAAALLGVALLLRRR